MFKKFSDEQTGSRSNIKSSVQRQLRQKLIDSFPGVEDHIDEFIPKKTQLTQVQCQDKTTLYTVDNNVVLVRHYDDLWPSLRLVHQLPRDALPWVTVDSGAIKFILGGANIMCPGLTSAGADIPHDYPAGQTVVVYAEGKEHALAIARLDKSTEDIKKENKGIGASLVLYLGDGVWNYHG